jgi:hypothetical protein
MTNDSKQTACTCGADPHASYCPAHPDRLWRLRTTLVFARDDSAVAHRLLDELADRPEFDGGVVEPTTRANLDAELQAGIAQMIAEQQASDDSGGQS